MREKEAVIRESAVLERKRKVDRSDFERDLKIWRAAVPDYSEMTMRQRVSAESMYRAREPQWHPRGGGGDYYSDRAHAATVIARLHGGVVDAKISRAEESAQRKSQDRKRIRVGAFMAAILLALALLVYVRHLTSLREARRRSTVGAGPDESSGDVGPHS